MSIAENTTALISALATALGVIIPLIREVPPQLSLSWVPVRRLIKCEKLRVPLRAES